MSLKENITDAVRKPLFWLWMMCFILAIIEKFLRHLSPYSNISLSNSIYRVHFMAIHGIDSTIFLTFFMIIACILPRDPDYFNGIVATLGFTMHIFNSITRLRQLDSRAILRWSKNLADPTTILEVLISALFLIIAMLDYTKSERGEE